MEGKGKNLEIEVLRGVAILITIYAHMGSLVRWLPEAYMKSFSYFSPAVGVDLFFCISGYLITKSLYKESSKENGFSYFSIPFWVRRMWRLWPSSFLWLAITLICAKFFNTYNSFGSFDNNLYSSVSAIFQVTNFYFSQCIQSSSCGSNMVYWSLSLEEQFYLIFPFLLFFIPRKYITTLVLIAIAVQFFTFRAPGSLAWTTRTDAILVGVLIGLHDKKIANLKILRDTPTSFFVYACFCSLIALLIMVPATNYGAMTGFTTIICAMMVVLASSNHLKIIPNGFLMNILAYIGGRSYSIYLVHIPVFLMTYEIYSTFYGSAASSGSGLSLVAIAAPAVIILSELNYRFIEAPLIRTGKAYAKRYRYRRAKLISPCGKPTP